MIFQGEVEHIAIDGERGLSCARYGDPKAERVMVFDPGSFGIYADADHIAVDLARRGWYCILTTRAGMYGSDPLPEGQAPLPRFHVEDIGRLLDRLDLGRKVVLAGHSMSGVRLHLAGCMMPERLHGLACLDAVCPSLMRGIRWSGWVAWARGIGQAGAKVAGTAVGDLVETLHPNLLQLEGPPRADKLASINSQKHLETAAWEVAVTERRALKDPIEPALSLPAFFATATPVSQGTTSLLTEYEQAGTWARRIHLKKDGHMSMLTPPSSGLIADGVEALWVQA
ncbi:alpha/beta fold hydrolase [Parvularcula sp. ZS-1/3]|uniref:Alpha/beta fold hydrolase n=1 Tax=Parvularcula mediterranea TaxID=2732508 RepID=A0A7Y3RIU2_9PROT|nr:alpha/beta hydrolase [Parvularcula mediterranea]NNU14875.1 alpha/beta fold hydrolase [Parvularcula mediterranea]